MTLRLRNTLSRRVEAVEPIEPGRVRMYTCGPTVYRYAHVGNLRSYLLADLIRRVLLYHGVDVLHVKNITDVGHLRDERADRGEDRMLAAAGLEGRPPAEIADAYEAAFHADEAAVNILPAHAFPRATDHIDDMVRLTERLVDAGAAYATPAGTVYFSVSALPGYGRLSGNTLDELRAGHRGEVETDKRDPADFALWKSAGEGRLLAWPTPRWGVGFPGWHIECTAMSLRHLGDEFDIHTGGIDNVFPHHEDEIAQATPLTGRPPARVWVHGEHLLMDGHKMAKSAGNFQRITEVSTDGVDPLAFRYLCLTVRHGHKLRYSDASIAGAAVGLASLRARLRELGPPPSDGPWAAPAAWRAGWAGDRPAGRALGPLGHQAVASDAPRLIDRAHGPTPPLSQAARRLHERFVGAIDDDLDTPAAVAIVREALRADASNDERRWLVLDADAVFGLDLDLVWASADLPVGAEQLIEDRASARAERDYARADALREELLSLGVEVTDRGDGTTEWRVVQRT